MRRLPRVLALVALCASQTQAASAATADGEGFAPMALVQPTCLAGASGYGFGNGDDDQTGMTALVSITCTRTTPWSVLINAGRSCGAAAITSDPAGAQFNVVYSPFPDVAGVLGSLESLVPGSIYGMGTSTPQLLTIHFGAVRGQRVQTSAGSDAIVAEITY